MVRRSISLAVSVAALAVVTNDVFADLQETHRASWTLAPERSGWTEEKAEARLALSPTGVSSAELGWLKTTDLKPGGGLQLDIAQSWALYADWERYRPRAVQVRETVDTLLLGLQFSFH
jgi:hypothetical protein